MAGPLLLGPFACQALPSSARSDLVGPDARTAVVAEEATADERPEFPSTPGLWLSWGSSRLSCARSWPSCARSLAWAGDPPVPAGAATWDAAEAPDAGTVSCPSSGPAWFGWVGREALRAAVRAELAVPSVLAAVAVLISVPAVTAVLAASSETAVPGSLAGLATVVVVALATGWPAVLPATLAADGIAARTAGVRSPGTWAAARPEAFRLGVTLGAAASVAATLAFAIGWAGGTSPGWAATAGVEAGPVRPVLIWLVLIWTAPA